MFLRRSLVLVVSILLASAAATTGALAGSTIEFTDGRYLRVPAYEIDGSWLRVDFENRAYVFFPLRKVARIDTEGKVAYRPSAERKVRAVVSRNVEKAARPATAHRITTLPPVPRGVERRTPSHRQRVPAR